MIVLYTMKSASPNVRKISIMLEEIGLPYTTKHVEKRADGTFADNFLAISPNATVPAIWDDDTGSAVFESAAILWYLAEKANQCLPDTITARAEVIKWLIFEAANVGPVMGELYHYMLFASEDLSAVHRYKDKLTRYCSILDRQLSGRTYICGSYSIADMALYPWSVILEDIAEIRLSDYPNLSKWAATVGARTAARPVMAAGNNGVNGRPSVAT